MSERRFAYHRAVAPLMWVFVALAGIELVVVHLLIAFWSRTAAAILSALTLASMVWLIGVIASMRRLPVLLDDRRLLMRVGTLKCIDLPLDQIAGLRSEWDGAAVKHRSVLNLALIAYPNVVIDLRHPRPGSRGVVAIAHRLDDPGAFVTALRERLAPQIVTG